MFKASFWQWPEWGFPRAKLSSCYWERRNDCRGRLDGKYRSHGFGSSSHFYPFTNPSFYPPTSPPTTYPLIYLLAHSFIIYSSITYLPSINHQPTHISTFIYPPNHPPTHPQSIHLPTHLPSIHQTTHPSKRVHVQNTAEHLII